MRAKLALSALAVGVILVGVLAANSSSVVVAVTIVALTAQGLLLLRADARSHDDATPHAMRGYD